MRKKMQIGDTLLFAVALAVILGTGAAFGAALTGAEVPLVTAGAQASEFPGTKAWEIDAENYLVRIVDKDLGNVCYLTKNDGLKPGGIFCLPRRAP